MIGAESVLINAGKLSVSLYDEDDEPEDDGVEGSNEVNERIEQLGRSEDAGDDQEDARDDRERLERHPSRLGVATLYLPEDLRGPLEHRGPGRGRHRVGCHGRHLCHATSATGARLDTRLAVAKLRGGDWGRKCADGLAKRTRRLRLSLLYMLSAQGGAVDLLGLVRSDRGPLRR